MKIETLVQPASDVVRVVRLTAGDIYKRLETPTYGETRMLYGTVLDVAHDGETGALSVLEFMPAGYASEVGPVLRVIATGTRDNPKDVSVFPCPEYEFRQALHSALDLLDKAIHKDTLELDRKKAVRSRLVAVTTAALAPAQTGIWNPYGEAENPPMVGSEDVTDQGQVTDD